jgi:1-acyl-sn-glycerol-3-phosphate acyltransferase
MALISPLLISYQLLAALGTRTFLYHQDRIPQDGSILVVSNHRSFMDAPLLMAALNRTIRFACHHYMGQVPVMREIVSRLGCFPLDTPDQRQRTFFHQASQLLQNQEIVGIFPEGALPMVQATQGADIGVFQRGFAHLALRAPVQDLAILPLAIASQYELTNSVMPLRYLSWFDPSEPLFQQSGWHPMVVYQHVNLLVGQPVWITQTQRQDYQGKRAKAVVTELVEHCHAEIRGLLSQGS